jgi:hypothetical protein
VQFPRLNIQDCEFGPDACNTIIYICISYSPKAGNSTKSCYEILRNGYCTVLWYIPPWSFEGGARGSVVG